MMGHPFRTVSCLAALLVVQGAGLATAFAQSGEASCPPRGTRFSFSDGTRIESTGEGRGPVCRFKSLRTEKTFERLFGAFDPSARLVNANLEKFRSLSSMQVGQKIHFTSAGAGDKGADGIWFYDVVVEKAEQVQTPAGAFASFVILYDEESPQSTKGKWQRRYWYAPQVGYTVKFDYQAIRGNPPKDYPKNWMLTEYRTVSASR